MSSFNTYKVVGKTLLGIAVGITLLLVITPYILSSKWGNSQIISMINGRIPGHFDSESIELSWLGPQIVKKVTLQDPSNQPVARVTAIQSSVSLFSLLLEGLKQGKLQVEDLDLDLHKLPNGQTNLQTALGTYLTVPQSIMMPSKIRVEKANATVTFPDHGNPLSIVATGTTQENSSEGTFQINLILSEKNPQFDISLKQFPLSLIDQFVTIQSPLRSKLGDVLDLTAKNLPDESSMRFSGELKASALHFGFTGAIQPMDQIELELQQFPVAFLDAILGDKHQLQNTMGQYVNAVIKTDIKTFHDVTLSLQSENLYVDNMQLELGETVKLKMPALIHYTALQNMSKDRSTVHLDVEKLLLNIKDASYSITAKSTGFPTSVLCSVCSEDLQHKVEALFGSAIDAEIAIQITQLSGPVKAVIKGSRGNMHLDARIEQGLLLLNAPFEMDLTASPALGESILQDYFSILSGVVSADNPIKIKISPKGFSLPIFEKKLGEIKLEDAVIELGQMTFKKQGQLGDILSLLKSNEQDLLQIRFTPLYLNIIDGVLQVNRMDMLAMNRYPMALWGIVDLKKEKVNLRIGLTEAALANALGITNLPPEYMLQLPLKGAIGHAGVDKAKATGKISALLAQSHGSTEGMILGTFLNVASGALSEDAPPQPTTDPLPWKTYSDKPQVTQEEYEQDPKKKHKKESVLQKAANSLLESFLK